MVLRRQNSKFGGSNLNNPIRWSCESKPLGPWVYDTLDLAVTWFSY